MKLVDSSTFSEYMDTIGTTALGIDITLPNERDIQLIVQFEADYCEDDLESTGRVRIKSEGQNEKLLRHCLIVRKHEGYLVEEFTPEIELTITGEIMREIQQFAMDQTNPVHLDVQVEYGERYFTHPYTHSMKNGIQRLLSSMMENSG